MQNKDRRERAQVPLRNPLNDDVPITVVPDNQMPQYGAEVPSRSTNKVLEDLLSMIRTHQKPVTIPFAAGTPTEARRQFDWERDLRERQFAADQAYRNAQLALSRLRAGGSGGNIDEMGLSGTAWYQRTIQNAIQAGESLENITKDIVSAVPEMTQQKVNPADMMRFALGQFEHQYGSQKYVPGMKTDIKWFQNYKWYLDNKDDILRQADVLERQYKPADPTGPVTGAEYLTPEERQRIAEILDIPAADVDLYIKTNPGLISQLLGKQYDW